MSVLILERRKRSSLMMDWSRRRSLRWYHRRKALTAGALARRSLSVNCSRSERLMPMGATGAAWRIKPKTLLMLWGVAATPLSWAARISSMRMRSFSRLATGQATIMSRVSMK